MLFFNPDAPQEEKGNAQSFQTHIPFRRVYKDTYMAWNKTNVITDVFFFHRGTNPRILSYSHFLWPRAWGVVIFLDVTVFFMQIFYIYEDGNNIGVLLFEEYTKLKR